MMKNLIYGIMLSGIFIAASPLLPVAYKHISDLFVGFGPSYERDMGAMGLLFSIPLGFCFSIIGLGLNVVISHFNVTFKDSQTDRWVVITLALLFASVPASYLFIF